MINMKKLKKFHTRKRIKCWHVTIEYKNVVITIDMPKIFKLLSLESYIDFIKNFLKYFLVR